MPFFVYHLTRSNSGTIIADNPRGVRLAGKAGPFRKHAGSLFSGVPGGVLSWHLDEAQILHLLDVALGDHAVIVDLRPDHPTEVSLYRLRHVWGRSNPTWTPLAFQLEALFVDEPVKNPQAFKACFEMPAEQGDLIHEFLYLRGGTQSGQWVWGRNGTVNATLLWPDDFAWFVEQITPFVR